MFNKEKSTSKSTLRAAWKPRHFNCDKLLGTKEKCPHCGMFHLRPGYCSALDEIPQETVDRTKRLVYAKYGLRNETLSVVDETLSENETLTETLKCEVCGNEFQPKRRTARYCSSACRLKSHRT